jgi:tRNA-uridine 2-sulfurtransferase
MGTIHEEAEVRREKVIAAMSGGVDSSVAAALLVEQGYEVVGVTLNVWPRLPGEDVIERPNACCSLSAAEDARHVAEKLGIPHYVLNFRDIFAQTVISDFVNEYRHGRTPNPCLRCNELVKFEALRRRVEGLEADYVATGHYVRLEYNSARRRYLLRKAVDRNKDQSYFLYVLTQEQLAHALFPLAELTKDQTRAVARQLGLPVASKPESQEICFVPDNNYGGFLEERVPGIATPGPIIDKEGRVLGEHRGIIFYTIGQRRGLGLAAPRPLYVIAIDPDRNAVVVGEESDLYVEALVAHEVNLVAVEALTEPLDVTAKIRYRAAEVGASLTPLPEGRLQVSFQRPQKGVAPGQAVVFYDGDVVVGGGTILSARYPWQR